VLYGDGKERVRTRETREGWPLLSFETEVNGNSKSTIERGPSMVGLLAIVFVVLVQQIFDLPWLL
jgi:hypothetical protein